MRILVLTAYYEPEIAASMYLFTNLFEDLSNYGHTVTIITPTPSRGLTNSMRKIYKNKKKEVLFNGKLIIDRFTMYREGKGIINRTFRYLCINIITFFKAMRVKADVIFTPSTPPTQGALACIIKKFKKIPVIYNLQDIFPDSMVNAGLIKTNSFLWKIGVKIENYSYKKSDKIITISKGFEENLLKKGVSPQKICIIENWVDENMVVPILREKNELFDKYNLDKKKFYIAYSGNIGLSQNLEMLIDIAEELKDIQDIVFVVIGDGVFKNTLIDMVSRKQLSNFLILPFQDYEYISHVFSLADIGIVMSKKGIGSNSVPSKTWSIMSASRPIVASFDIDSDLNNIINEAECGFCIPAENKYLFKQKLLYLYNHNVLLNKLGENGRKYILKNLTREQGIKKYIDIFELFNID